MSEFRKRPVVIDAWRWMFSPKQEPAPAWVVDALWKWPAIGGIAFEPNHIDGARICIATLDAVAIASPGDWVCKGVKGELYPCKPDIFDELYDAVPEAVDSPSSKNHQK